jgi:hypothetical protein
MNRKKILIIFISFFLVLLSVFAVIYFSPIGENFLKNYISSKLGLLKNFQLEKFNYKWNSFSATLKNGSNFILLYGDIFPFDASYEANFNNLEEITSELRGKLESKGVVNYIKNKTNIEGNAIFAGGYGKLKLKCDFDCIGSFNGKEFDTQKLLYMLKEPFPYLIGKNDLNLTINKHFYVAYVNFTGDFKYKDKFYFQNVDLKGEIKIKDRNNKDIVINAISDKAKVNLFYKERNKKFHIKGKIFTNLEIFRKYVLYPVRGEKEIKFSYDNIGDILKFETDDFKGYVDKDNINIQFNNLDSKIAFNYLGLDPLFKGIVNGEISIKNIGEFSFVINNMVLLNSRLKHYIEKSIGLKMKKFNVMFLKGKFDKEKVIFNMLVKDKKLVASIENGVYFYNGDYKFNIDIIVDNNYKYVFSVTNKKIKLKKLIRSYKVKQKILVY